jgi:hypothetical protein
LEDSLKAKLFDVLVDVKGRMSYDYLRVLEGKKSLELGVDISYRLFYDLISLLINPT